MGLWFKLVSYIFLLLFFSIELFCSVKYLVCPYFIFLLVHSSTVVFFLTSPRKLSKGENERALRLSRGCRAGEILCWPNVGNPRVVLWGSSGPGYFFTMQTVLPRLCPPRPGGAAHGGLWDGETGRTSKQTVLLSSWVMLRNTFLLVVIIWLHSLIKVDLCDGYVTYIFLPLFLWDSGCIS